MADDLLFSSPGSNPKSVYSLLRCIAGSPSSSPNSPNCSPRESASVYTDYLRSHFSVSQLKALHIRAKGYLSKLRRATCSKQSHSSFCSPFSPAEFLAAASNLTLSTTTGPDKVAYPKALSSLWYGFSSSHFQSFLVSTFLSFYLEDIFNYSHP